MKNLFTGLAVIILLVILATNTYSQSDGTFVASAYAENSAVSIPASIVPSPEAKQAEAEAEPDGKFTYSGYFDTYYFANLNNPASRSNLGSSGISRGFDRYSGQFQLGMFLSRVAYSFKNTEFVGEIGFGPNAEYGSYGNDFRYRWGTVVANSTYSAIMIKQAYMTMKASDKLSFKIGRAHV